MKNILIAGLGISGFDAALLALYNNLNVTVIDTFDSVNLQNRAKELMDNGAKVHLGIAHFQNLNLAGIDTIIISPGIHPEENFGLKLKSLTIPIISELEFASHFCNIPLIGITGTNGKTTTVELLTHCLTGLGVKTKAAGNIGYSLSRVVRENQDWDYIVVEVSSFQLESIENIEFISGVLLNVSSDHIDRYTSFDEYASVKCRLLKHSKHKTAGISVSKYLKQYADVSYIDYQGGANSEYRLIDGCLDITDEKFSYQSHPLKGLHNAENILACFSVLDNLGFKSKDVFKISLSFKAPQHRLQFFLKHDEIIFINDSKATNPDALRMALESCGTQEVKNIVLIAGGRDKKMDFKVVNSALCSYVRKLFLYGECRQTLSDTWSSLLPCKVQKDFTEVVTEALKEIKAGDILLLSPGCSSLDSFSSYGERGKVFMQLVQEWTKNE